MISWLDKLEAFINSEISALSVGWDSYAANPPTPFVMHETLTLLKNLFGTDPRLEPNHLGPAVSGGIGITFLRGDNELVIEVRNSGDILLTEVIEKMNEISTKTEVFPAEKDSYDEINRRVQELLS